MQSRRLVLIALSCALLAAPALAHDYKLGTLEISHPWARATAPTAKAGGAYLRITNRGTTADRLIAVRSTAAMMVQIHETVMDGSVMRMRELDKGIEIAPGATIELKPGGNHVMFMDLKAPLVKDTRVPATLVFEKAGTIDVEFLVQAIGQGGMHH